MHAGVRIPRIRRLRSHIHDEQLRQWQQRDRHRPSGSPEEEPIPSKPAGLNVIDEDSAMSVSVVMVFSFVIFMGAVLVVLYLYVEYLVYFIHGIFALSSCVAVLGVLEPLVYKLPIGTTRLPANAIPCFHGSLEIRQALILVVAAVVPAVWVYYRHHERSWIIQDMLGVCFSVYILRTVRLPSLKG
ncbi:signal peptide peptidase-like 2B [Haemaphysalis longicornis]